MRNSNTVKSENRPVYRTSFNIMNWCFTSVFVLIMPLTSCFGQPTVYRHSGDFTHHVIYLGTNVAISKSIQAEAFDQSKTSYHVGRARWKGEPELANTTGDEFETDIESEPKRIGISNEHRWLVVEGRRFDESIKAYVSRVTVVSLLSGTSWSAADLNGLEKEVGRVVKVHSIKTEPAAVFFDRMLVAYFESKSRR